MHVANPFCNYIQTTIVFVLVIPIHRNALDNLLLLNKYNNEASRIIHIPGVTINSPSFCLLNNYLYKLGPTEGKYKPEPRTIDIFGYGGFSIGYHCPTGTRISVQDNHYLRVLIDDLYHKSIFTPMKKKILYTFYSS